MLVEVVVLAIAVRLQVVVVAEVMVAEEALAIQQAYPGEQILVAAAAAPMPTSAKPAATAGLA
jgi:hypothetical protein